MNLGKWFWNCTYSEIVSRMQSSGVARNVYRRLNLPIIGGSVLGIRRSENQGMKRQAMRCAILSSESIHSLGTVYIKLLAVLLSVV